MKIRRFTAENTRQAMLSIRNILGPEAVIISNRNTENGVEIKAGILEPTEVTQEELPREEEVVDLINLVKQQQKQTNEINKKPISMSGREVDDTMSSPAILNSDLDDMRQELKTLHQLLESQLANSAQQLNQTSSPKRVLLETRLTKLGFDCNVSRQIVDEVDLSLDLDTAWNVAKQRLIAKLQVSDQPIIDKQGVYAFIGGTGVGKTTSIAKLATQFVLKHGSEKLGLISTDFNRVSGKGQLFMYGRVLNVEVEVANNPSELKLALHKFRDKQLVLVDTAGVCQRDNLHVASVLEMLTKQQYDIKTLLVLPSTNQQQILQETVDAFYSDHCEAALITKIDEAASLTPIFNVILQEQLSICYLSQGQRIPQDLEVADAENMLTTLLVKANQFEKVAAASSTKIMGKITEGEAHVQDE